MKGNSLVLEFPRPELPGFKQMEARDVEGISG